MALDRTVRDWIDVVLEYTLISGKIIRCKQITHDPEQPPFHLEHRAHVASILDHVGDEEGRQSERRVEVRAHNTEGSEEALHGQERHIDL